MKHFDWIRANKTNGKGFGRGYTKAALNLRDKEHADRENRVRAFICRYIGCKQHKNRS